MSNKEQNLKVIKTGDSSLSQISALSAIISKVKISNRIASHQNLKNFFSSSGISMKFGEEIQVNEAHARELLPEFVIQENLDYETGEISQRQVQIGWLDDSGKRADSIEHRRTLELIRLFFKTAKQLTQKFIAFIINLINRINHLFRTFPSFLVEIETLDKNGIKITLSPKLAPTPIVTWRQGSVLVYF